LKNFPVFPSYVSVTSLASWRRTAQLASPITVSAIPLFLPQHLGGPGFTATSTRQDWLPGPGPSAVVGQPQHPAWGLLRPCLTWVNPHLHAPNGEN